MNVELQLNLAFFDSLIGVKSCGCVKSNLHPLQTGELGGEKQQNNDSKNDNLFFLTP